MIRTRHEQGAGFMAATYGRLTGKACVCLAALGPGAANRVTAAGYAATGDADDDGHGAKPRGQQGQFQIIDAVEMIEQARNPC